MEAVPPAREQYEALAGQYKVLHPKAQRIIDKTAAETEKLEWHKHRADYKGQRWVEKIDHAKGKAAPKILRAHKNGLAWEQFCQGKGHMKECAKGWFPSSGAVTA